MNIYVSNLDSNVQDKELTNFFAPYGEVTSAKVINDRITGKSRGFGFVEMSDNEAAKKAIQGLDQATVAGKTISVKEARPKNDGSGGNGGAFSSDKGFGNRNSRL